MTYLTAPTIGMAGPLFATYAPYLHHCVGQNAARSWQTKELYYTYRHIMKTDVSVLSADAEADLYAAQAQHVQVFPAYDV